MIIELIGGPRDGQIVEVPDDRRRYCVPEVSPIVDFNVEADVTSTCYLPGIHDYELSTDGLGFPSINDSGQCRFSYQGMTQ